MRFNIIHILGGGSKYEPHACLLGFYSNTRHDYLAKSFSFRLKIQYNGNN